MSEWRTAFERIRYAGEYAPSLTEGPNQDRSEILRHLWQSELSISEVVTPGLAACVDAVLQRLTVPHDVVQCFVFASPEIQAYCGWISDRRCVIRFSSALVDLLNPEEFEFVVGHELGHFLFSHLHRQEESDTLEDLMIRRAQEISVDRVGLLACDSLSASLAAMMKLASGLSERHLRFDVTRFIAQIEEAGPSLSHAESSHPSVLVRARALLWFSLLEPSLGRIDQLDPVKTARVDTAIAKDMERLNDSPIVEHLTSLEQDATLWAVVHQIVVSGGFTKAQQKRFEAAFGREKLDKVAGFLSELSQEDVHAITASRLNAAIDRFRAASPRRAREADQRIAVLAAKVVHTD